MSTEQSESAPAVTPHTQGETQAAPTVDATQQATTPTATTAMQHINIPSVWLLEKWLLKERSWHGKNRRKRLRLISRKTTRRKLPQPPRASPDYRRRKPKEQRPQHQPMDCYWQHMHFTARDLLQTGRAQGCIRQKNA